MTTDDDGRPPPEAARDAHQKAIARAFSEFTDLCRSDELHAEKKRLWDDEAPRMTDEGFTPFWLEVEWIEQQFIGYVSQLARWGTLRQDPNEVVETLSKVRVFTEPRAAEWYKTSAARYPSILRYLHCLDYLRLLAREHVVRYFLPEA